MPSLPYDRIREPNPKLRRDLVRLVEAAVRTRIPAYPAGQQPD